MKIAELVARNSIHILEALMRDPDVCKKYSELPASTCPPIYVEDVGHLLLIDGAHRVVAAMLRGESEIESLPWPRK
jgi:hypothetical protein